jgi:flavin-binding protein dodecin
MSVAKNIEITSSSTKSFEDAINHGIERASRTLENVSGAWIKEQKITIENGQSREFRVTMILTFILDGGIDSAENRSSNRSGGTASKSAKKSGRGKK